tara:strand:+ start:12609 stop:14195 length:1587 start_codon:yes stop_codon:yes gene_type:complete
MNSSVEELDVLLRAGYPILYVVSHEEDRVAQALNRIVTRKNKVSGFASSFWTWSITDGSTHYKNGKQTERFDSHDSPLEVLDYIESYKKTGVFMLKDFGHFLTEGPAYLVQRKLKDLTTTMAGGTTIVIVDSELHIPPRLEKIISVIDFDLPDRKAIETRTSGLLETCEGTANLSDADKDALLKLGSNAALGMTLAEAENIFAKSLAMHGTLDVKTIMSEKKNIIRKSGVLEYYEVSNDMKSVGGLVNLKGWLDQRGRAFSDEAKAFGLPNPKGVLIIGIPGTGKSLVSKTIGYEWDMPLLKLDVGALFGSLVGQSEANVRKAIQTAEALAPCVLWIDELEKGFGNVSGGGDSGTTARVFGSFLSWMQDKTAPVFVVATANDVSALPPEMLRKGRFDELFFVDLPSKADREEIFNIHLSRFNKPILSEMDADGDNMQILATTEGFSGAEIEQIVVDGMFAAFAEGRDHVMIEDFEKAVENTVPLSMTMEDRIEKLRKWANGRATKANDSNEPVSIRNGSRSNRRRQIG